MHKTWILLGLLTVAGATAHAADVKPLVVKVIVVTTFEVGADTGDQPGEFQYWAEREKWYRKVMVPGMVHPVYVSDKGELAVVSGAPARCAEQIMALAVDPRFDFTHAYWMLAGIAGANPSVASVASASWAKYIIDGDIAYEIDSRETPQEWPYGVIPIGSKKPNELPHYVGWAPTEMAFPLNPALVARAYSVTKDVALMDTPELASFRAAYQGFPNALKPPFVLVGDVVGSNRYWHGAIMAHWAEDWTKIWTNGKGRFTMTAMEDHGYAAALTELDAMGKVDFQRVLDLRAASNYCMPAPGETAADSLEAGFVSYIPAVETDYRVGSVMVHDILAHWDDVYAAGVK